MLEVSYAKRCSGNDCKSGDLSHPHNRQHSLHAKNCLLLLFSLPSEVVARENAGPEVSGGCYDLNTF